MKGYFIVSIVLTFGFLQCASAMSMAEPISAAFMITLSEDQIPTEEMCPDNYKEIEQLKIQATRLGMTMEPMITEKLPNSSSADGLEDLIAQNCIPNKDVQNNAESTVSNLKSCLSGKSNLSDEKIAEIKKNIVQNICNGLSAMVQWQMYNRRQYMERQGLEQS